MEDYIISAKSANNSFSSRLKLLDEEKIQEGREDMENLILNYMNKTLGIDLSWFEISWREAKTDG
jgi:hypothetical protein